MKSNNDAISRQTLKRAIYIINKLTEGKNPFTSENLSKEDIVNNEKINLCLKYVENILENLSESSSIKLEKVQVLPFEITPQQKKLVKFPEYNIGISEFARCVNEVIDTEKYKKVTAKDLNKGLKQMDILHDIQNPKTKKVKTIVNPDFGIKYGIAVNQFEIRGINIEKVEYDDRGKQFLLDNIENIILKAKECKDNTEDEDM